MAADEPRKQILGLDRARLIESATYAGGLVVVMFALSDIVGSRIEAWAIALYLSFFVLLTLFNYVVHVVTRDRLRDHNMRLWPRKNDKNHDS